jgi:hypothetical protein
MDIIVSKYQFVGRYKERIKDKKIGRGVFRVTIDENTVDSLINKDVNKTSFFIIVCGNSKKWFSETV